MIEEKIKAEFPKEGNRIVGLGNTEIQVSPFLNHQEQQLITEIYLKELYAEENGNHNMAVLNAENALTISILNYSTNLLTIEEKDGKEVPVISLNDLYAHPEFVKNVFSNIKNYKEFRERLNATIEFANEQRRLTHSVGSKVDLIISKIINFIDNLSDITPERLEEMKESLKDIQGSEILTKAISIFQNKAESK